MAKILVVDDNAINRKLLVALLSHDGHLTTEASDGMEGLQVARAERPQLVISDIIMPTMDGFDFVRALRGDADLRGLPVIFYTANYHAREAQKLADACHVARVLVKPCAPAEILKTVDQVMAGVSESGRFFMPETFDREHLLLVTNKLAAQTEALAASNARLVALGLLNVQIAALRDPHAILQAACSGARNLIGSRYAVATVVRESPGATCHVASGIDPDKSLTPPASGSGPLAAVMAQRRPWRAADVAPASFPFPPDYPAASAFLAVPLATPTHGIGWLCLADKLGAEQFNEEDERLLGGFAALVAQLHENAAATELQKVIDSLRAEVDARRAAEEHLGEMQQNLTITLASIDAGLIAVDREGRVSRMNSVAERVTGWTEAQARGRSFWEVFVRDGRPAAYLGRNPVELLLERRDLPAESNQIVVVSRSGARTPVEYKAAITEGASGEARGLAVVFRDMSRLMRAESDSMRLAAIVDSSTDAIIGKTLEGRITSWNHGAEVLFGYSAAEAIGRPVQMLIPDDRQDEEMRILADIWRGITVPAYDTLRRTKDGRLIDVSLTISPIRDAEGRVVGAAKIVRDISSQRFAEEMRRNSLELTAENKRIQEASRLKSQFLANMSHELRTPLNAIIGFADLLHTGTVPPDSPKVHEYLGYIGDSGRHLLQLINDVLDLSKVESGKLEFYPEPLHLPTLVKEVSDILRADIERKHLTLTIDLDDRIGELWLDHARLKQALFNYLSNAIKFTPPGGSISVRAHTEGPAHFRLEVEDSGIGIAQEDIPRLFNEFTQLDTGYDKHHPGTGLGLALTRRLIETQGGTVGVRSALGTGSVFHLILRRVHGALECA